MSNNTGKIIHIKEFGLCEVVSKGTRFAYTRDELPGYAGQPLRDTGLRVGAEIVFQSDEKGRVSAAQVARAAAAGS